jgi:hypothetical protein
MKFGDSDNVNIIKDFSLVTEKLISIMEGQWSLHKFGST